MQCALRFSYRVAGIRLALTVGLLATGACSVNATKTFVKDWGDHPVTGTVIAPIMLPFSVAMDVSGISWLTLPENREAAAMAFEMAGGRPATEVQQEYAERHRPRLTRTELRAASARCKEGDLSPLEQQIVNKVIDVAAISGDQGDPKENVMAELDAIDNKILDQSQEKAIAIHEHIQCLESEAF